MKCLEYLQRWLSEKLVHSLKMLFTETSIYCFPSKFMEIQLNFIVRRITLPQADWFGCRPSNVLPQAAQAKRPRHPPLLNEESCPKNLERLKNPFIKILALQYQEPYRVLIVNIEYMDGINKTCILYICLWGIVSM